MFKILKQKSKGLILLLSLIALLPIVFANNAKAETFRGLIINQVKFDISKLEKGNTIEKSFTVTHDFEDKSKVTTLYPRALDFSSDNKSGVPKFLPTGTLAREASLASWIRFEKSKIVLTKFGQVETIKFYITVPNNAEPGGKYAAVLLSEQETFTSDQSLNNTNFLGVTKELGPIVLLNVDGDLTRRLETTDFFISDIKNNRRGLFNNPPVNLNLVIKNTGNVHVIPEGKFYIYKGKNNSKKIAEVNINSGEGYVLPNSSREFTGVWEDSFITSYVNKDGNGKESIKTKYDFDKLSKLSFGRYKAVVEYKIKGDDTQTYTKEVSFWVIPWQVILVVILLILIIAIPIIVSTIIVKRNKKKLKL